MTRCFTATLILFLSATTAAAQSTAQAPPKSRDSVIEGLLIGTAAGFAAAYTFTRVNCGPPGYDRECAVYANLVGYPIFVPAGAVVGALIDRAIGNNRVTVAPVVGRREAALNATIRLGRDR
jgi:hypothetical protein